MNVFDHLSIEKEPEDDIKGSSEIIKTFFYKGVPYEY